MKISFSKINSIPYPFKLNLENIIFEGNLVKINSKLVKITAKMTGHTYKNCDRCGDEIELCIDENLEVLASDGIYKDENNNLDNVVEFFDSQIDIMEVAISEFESYLSDYFYCEKCE